MSKRRSSVNPPNRDDCLLATHPSDHNAVYVNTVSHKGREKRLSKTQKRKARDLAKLKDGKLDEKTYHRGLDHNAAFLVPVPVYYGYGFPTAACAGIGGGFGVGCATVSGYRYFVVYVSVISSLLSIGCGRVWGNRWKLRGRRGVWRWRWRWRMRWWMRRRWWVRWWRKLIVNFQHNWTVEYAAPSYLYLIQAAVARAPRQPLGLVHG